jgi:serine protease DegS
MKKGHFIYFSAWLLVGTFIGGLILYLRGDLQLSFDVSGNDSGFAETAGYATPLPRQGFSDAVAIASPSVVSIQSTAIVVESNPTTSQQDALQQFLGLQPPNVQKPRTDVSSGSGVIFSNDGYILTNYHVISNRGKIEIKLYDGRQLPAKLIGSDPETDIAVIKTEASQLPVMDIANIHQLKVGDIVLAIGDPFSIGQTVTQGIISATGRTRVTQNTYENFIQTDAAINPGNSGGALINTRGELVGINSNIYSSTGNYQGISFAIPIDLAKEVAESIIKNGYVVRGWLGVEGQEIDAELMRLLDLSNQHGVLITDVDKDGPGDKAGLKRGDIITRINQNRIANTNDVLNMIAAGRPGDEFLIEGYRNRQSFMTRAVLGERPIRSR